MVEISPPPKAFPTLSKSPLYHKSLPNIEQICSLGKRVLREERGLKFWGLGKEDVVWGKGTFGNIKGKGPNLNQLKPEGSRISPQIRLTARKRVPNQFEKFTFSIPAPARETKAQAQSETAQAIHKRDPHASTIQHDLA